ncbi:MAG: hypothetical protein D6694_00590 [Gammaproteobacteria bacterium]|nr:MAG: hypothetical protein D6694_00590 [Gammaproteobacteria bacterium]
MRKTLIGCLILFLFVFFFVSTSSAHVNDISFIERMILSAEHIVKKTNKGRAYSEYGAMPGVHTGCILCWAQSRFLDGYLDLYLLTKDEKWLRLFIQQARLAISQAENLPYHENGKGDTARVWVTTSYTAGIPHAFLVHATKIIKPFLRFALIVRQNGLSSYTKDAMFFVEVSQKSFLYFGKDWRDSLHGLSGFVEENSVPSNLAGEFLPWNMQAAAGQVCILLFDLTKESRFKKMAIKIAMSLKRHMEVKENRLLWPYWTRLSGQRSRYDDIGHGSSVAEFIVLMHERSWVFDDKDINRLLNTFDDLIDDRRWLAYQQIDGKGMLAFRPTLFLWAPLAQYSPTVCKKMVRVYMHSVPEDSVLYYFQPDYRGVMFQATTKLATYCHSQ